MPITMPTLALALLLGAAFARGHPGQPGHSHPQAGPDVLQNVCACVDKYNLCSDTCTKMEQVLAQGDTKCQNAHIGAVCSGVADGSNFDPGTLYSEYCPAQCGSVIGSSIDRYE